MWNGIERLLRDGKEEQGREEWEWLLWKAGPQVARISHAGERRATRRGRALRRCRSGDYRGGDVAVPTVLQWGRAEAGSYWTPPDDWDAGADAHGEIRAPVCRLHQSPLTRSWSFGVVCYSLPALP